MSTCRQLWQVTSLLAALAFAGFASADGVSAAEAVGRLATYEKAPGDSYFALSLMPKVAPDADQANDVVVLFDTSASQAGVFRDDGLAALGALLAGLGAKDRVHLMAVDVKAVPMTEGFVAADSPQMQAALAKLRQRVPLGATDLDAGLRSAAAGLASAKAAKTVVYLGDGMSKANLPNAESFGALVEDLSKNRVTVSSFVIGKEHNVQVLAALANQTGGVLATDAQAAEAAVNAGKVLAGSIHGSVIWPTEIALPASLGETLPKDVPPLRTDRDSILIGKLVSPDAGDVKITGEMNGRPIELLAKVTPEKSNEDFAFLPRLIEVAQADGGVSLPTLGSAGLREAAAITMTSAEQLAKLGHDALAAGNVTGAVQAAEAALARDPKNPEAVAVREAARKMAASGKAPAPKNAEPELKLVGLNQPAEAAAAPADGSLLAEVLAEKPGFLKDVETQRQVIAGKIQAEVENGLNAARKLMQTSPEQAEQDLKVMMENVERSVELDPEVRRQLREQIENAIRQAQQQKLVVDVKLAAAQEHAAQAADLQRLNEELQIKNDRLAQIMSRFNALMAERRFTVVVEEVIPEIERLVPNTSLEAAVVTGGRFQRSFHELKDVWARRQQGWLAGLYAVEASFIPFSDDSPIVYPDSEWWEKISIDRIEKYGSMDLLKPDSREQDIFNALKSPTDLEFVETPLKDAIDFLAEKHEIPIVLNSKKLEEAGVNIDTPVTKRLKGITLRSALRLMLGELELTYMVKDEVLQITTPEDAESPDNMVTKVYNVGDLVVPIQQNNQFGIGGLGGGMGGMMGGMGGGMMGGMGGGMMGGGMGGMGGGMGGMGGGFFAVEDDLSLGGKKQATAPTTEEPKVRRPAPEAAAKPAVAKKAERITLAASPAPASSVTTAQTWDAYFSEQKSRLMKLDDPTSSARELMASVRETVRQLMQEKKYGEVTSLIQAALRQGQIEPWMYEAMGLAMQADFAPPEDLERAFMSAVDFARSHEEVMVIAQYMASIGLNARALSLCKQLALADPSRPEPFVQALALAKRTNDVDAIKWATAGVMTQSFTGEDIKIAEAAYRTAKTTYEMLLSEGKKHEAEALDAAIRKAKRRDCVVVVTWTGEADVDIAVEEPAGTVCSLHQPRTTSGGVHLGDTASIAKDQSTKGFSETYVCNEAFSGQYRLLIKNVWGKPTSRKVTVDVYTNFGTDQQRVIHDQVPLDDKNAAVVFEIKDGRRKDALPEAQVAQVAKVQNALNKQVLAQQLAGMSDSEAASNFARALALAGQNGQFPFFRRGAVGYRPDITVLPEGAGFQATAVISADRRYVRVSPTPFFSQVNEVSTFNFVTGQGSTQQQGQGGGGGIGFGGGGGLGGGVF
jgi:hypothetical protein